MDLQDQRDALLIDLAASLAREDAAISVEREACARLADEVAFGVHGASKALAKRIAVEIRARSNAELRGATDD